MEPPLISVAHREPSLVKTITAMFRDQSPESMDRVFSGAKSAHDIPIYQTTKFDFVINLKTAKALGIEIPPSLVLRADKVVE